MKTITLLLSQAVLMATPVWCDTPANNLHLAGIFGEHMVLQQGCDLPFGDWLGQVPR